VKKHVREKWNIRWISNSACN